MAISSIANCARFYSLPEVPKFTISFCSIVSNAVTAFYKLACFLSQSLAHLTYNNLYTVKNS